ncbi:MAG: hypothetical protein R3318_03210, partial [Gammaproteobacteria bacterium]|nr:hypothetical protein [Gammaproteobacteria bacterium]
FTGDYWLPVQSLDLQSDWSPETPEFRVGEPVTLTLKLMARGLPASQLPEIRPEFPEPLKIYPDQPVLENRSSDKDLVGTRVEKLAMIPSRPGNFTLPEIRIPYWSVADETVKVARVPGQDIEVLPAITGDGASQALAPEEIFVSGSEPETVSSPVTDRPLSADSISDQSLALWQGLAIVLLLAWLTTLYFWWRSVRQQGHVASETGKSSATRLFRQVEAACRNNDPRACKQALLDWASAYWPENPPRNPGEISARLDHRLRKEVNELNDALYSPGRTEWDGNSFREALTAAVRTDQNQPGERNGSLEPMFRIN